MTITWVLMVQMMSIAVFQPNEMGTVSIPQQANGTVESKKKVASPKGSHGNEHLYYPTGINWDRVLASHKG